MTCKTSYLLLFYLLAFVFASIGQNQASSRNVYIFYYQIHKIDPGPLMFCVTKGFWYIISNIPRELPDDSAGSELFMILRSFFLRAFIQTVHQISHHPISCVIILTEGVFFTLPTKINCPNQRKSKLFDW